MIDHFFTGKIRLRLLVRLLLNPGNQVYLRQLERELQVSSNTVRLELNKLSEMKLINVVDAEDTKIKKYIANNLHPLYSNLRSIVLKYVGVDSLMEEIFNKLGNVQEVFLTGDFANGIETPFIDLVLVGDIDRDYLHQLVERAEQLLHKKIRMAIYSAEEFHLKLFEGIQHVSIWKEQD
ncbi:MAG: ArsR family transcriptional regulator [Chitinophagia bacterium]|nr:ArsR family transcriptional regulator [Chitinophagia bacterium]